MIHNKKIFKKEILIFITTCLMISQHAFALNDPFQDKATSWQMKQIYQPGQHLLDRENRGFVNIYDGFTDTQVDHIMDQKFGRLENMMFTRVKKTDPKGQVLKDPVSGKEIVTDDGCD